MDVTTVNLEPTAAEAVPGMRLVRIDVAGPGTLPDEQDQRLWGTFNQPGNRSYIKLLLGYTEPGDVSEIIDQAARDATRPLEDIRAELERGPLFSKAQRLRGQLDDTERQRADHAAAADRALTSARQALANGTDPTEAERAYKHHCQDRDVYGNRVGELRRLYNEAQQEARSALNAAVEERRRGLMADAQAKDAELSAQLADAVSALLPEVLRAKAIKSALRDRRDIAQAAGQFSGLDAPRDRAGDTHPQRLFELSALSGAVYAPVTPAATAAK